MLHDLRKAEARRKEVERRELNQPVIVKQALSLGEWPAARDAAVLAWFERLFKFYDIDPAAATRWEQLAMRLAFKQFPKFALLDTPPKVGSRGTKEARLNLFREFESYTPPRGGGSIYKKFLRDHPAACERCNIKEGRSLKEAIRLARRQDEVDRRDQELLIRHAAARALGIEL